MTYTIYLHDGDKETEFAKSPYLVSNEAILAAMNVETEEQFVSILNDDEELAADYYLGSGWEFYN